MLRAARPDDLIHIQWALHTAVTWDPARQLPPHPNILQHPQLVIFHRDWMRPGDVGVIAEQGSEVTGVAFCRVFTDEEHGEGFVDRETPELAIAVAADHRGRGLGGGLLEALSEAARRAGFRRLSLSVDVANPARHLYERHGYRVLSQDDRGLLMLVDL